MKNIKRVILTLFVVVLVVTISFPRVLIFLGLPEYCQIVEGNKESLNVRLPFRVSVNSNGSSNLKVNGHKLSGDELEVNLAKPMALQSSSVGSYNLDFRLFGIIPLRRMVVNVLPEVKVIPGGQSLGVILKSDGIMVVRNSNVIDEQGKKHFPARAGGIEVGDSLLELNGKKINSKYHLADLINRFGKEGEDLIFKVKDQEGKISYKSVTPIKGEEGYYMIGIYVDDGATGVGTMTFYSPETGDYGALGHTITEANSQLKIDVGEGEIVMANISGITQGQRGSPGEKLGTFFNDQGVLGNITKNNDFGIYGKLSIEPEHPFFDKPIPVASPLEIKEDRAKIYTVIEGGNIEEFEVNIDKVRRQHNQGEKGLIVRIVDEDLLERTGGIVQGMSGSPIVQNGKLVGAITHVFVNDSTRGYGMLAQWMIMETELLEEKEEKNTKELVS
ncbi:SpoIVB peptidase [Halonatronum saccharophilum]|uniref:SpoIVB peptidase n=1 Tax=Halonatronum saccharophilum TaxID=150060 RepID=UPI000481108C|nr:SpoIVB peptidase [Halonatronum saccharophilum]